MKKIAILTIVSALMLVACEQQPAGITPSQEIKVSPTPVMTSLPSVQPSTKPEVTPEPKSSVVPSPAESPKIQASPTPRPIYPSYDPYENFPVNIDPVVPGVRFGYVSFLFTRDSQITYDNENKKFVTSKDYDLTYINSLIEQSISFYSGVDITSVAFISYEDIPNSRLKNPYLTLEKRKVRDLPANEKTRMLMKGLSEEDEVYYMFGEEVEPVSILLKADFQVIIYKLRTEPYIYTAFYSAPLSVD